MTGDLFPGLSKGRRTPEKLVSHRDELVARVTVKQELDFGF